MNDDIVQKDTAAGAVLRKISAPVPVEKIDSEEIRSTLARMHETLKTQDDGVALAAPQIGVSLRIFIVAPRVFRDDPETAKLVFINPEIIKQSSDKKLLEEGCLSVRWWYGKIRRASRATVRAYDEDGREFEMSASGLLAQIFQHEIDHLDGILFVDNATELKEMDDAQERDAMQKRREKQHAE